MSDVDPHLDIYSIENQIQESLEGFKEPLTEVLTEPLTEPPSNVCSTEKDSSLYLSLTQYAFIMSFMANSYYILQIHHAKSFKMSQITYLYSSYLPRYS